MGHVAVCVQGIQSMADLQEEVFEELGVADLSVGPHEVEEVAVAALLEDHDWLSYNGLVALTPLVKLVPIVARDIPRHLDLAAVLIEGLEGHDVLMVAKLLVDLHLGGDVTE